MVVEFLCMVCAILLFWVIILKLEVQQLKGKMKAPISSRRKVRGTSGVGTEGNKKFTLG